MDQMSLRLIATNMARQQAMNDFEQQVMQGRNDWLFQAFSATISGNRIPNELPAVEEPKIDELISVIEESLRASFADKPSTEVTDHGYIEEQIDQNNGNQEVLTESVHHDESVHVEPEENKDPLIVPELALEPETQDPPSLEPEVLKPEIPEQQQESFRGFEEPNDDLPKRYDEVPDLRFKGISGILGNLRLVRKNQN